MDMARNDAATIHRTNGFAGWSVDVLTGGSPATSVLVTGLLLTLSWSIALRLGSEGGGAQWFLVPILYAAVALGSVGAGLAALLAALLGGPLLPADVATAVPQQPALWLARGALFVALGQVAAILVHRRRDLKRRLEPYEEVARRRDREAAEILELIREDRLAVYFQPIVDLGTGRIVGMESLARFPLEEEQNPEPWFRRAWAAGVGPDLEIAALKKAVDLSGDLPRPAYQAVNLSPEILISGRFQDLLATLPWTRLVVEITEHLEIGDYQRLARPIAAIRARGGRLAIDDVGAGFASLQHVLSLSPDIIKLDRSLSHGIELNQPRAALARGLVACAEELGATVVAEGIETPEDARGLRRVGAHCGQGYLFGRPAALEHRRVVRVPEVQPSTDEAHRAKPA
jgi:EAL domain-containing protein (putative c-di-GMP-specific phosphodiesterase class I)